MGRRVFFSFHYKPDSWRASQVRNIGKVEGNSPASDNDWETITKGGDAAIKKWIDEQMKGRSCVVVLVGENTAGRKWINYEIKKAWGSGKGLVGIHVNKLKNSRGLTAAKGRNPFAEFTVDGKRMDQLVKCHTPTGTTSTAAFEAISNNLKAWIEDAVNSR
ncbi:MAG: TIR domain-containing protein [Gammaproteobacteria bacterium]|nr:TIR domain-containing protein [Gammaproteobacteria bacterium]